MLRPYSGKENAALRPVLQQINPSVAAAVAVEVNEADERRFVERNSLPRGDFVKRVVNVRQVIGGDVANEGARDFIVAHAAMQPAEK
jgi:hypothetical protein